MGTETQTIPRRLHQGQVSIICPGMLRCAEATADDPKHYCDQIATTTVGVASGSRRWQGRGEMGHYCRCFLERVWLQANPGVPEKAWFECTNKTGGGVSPSQRMETFAEVFSPIQGSATISSSILSSMFETHLRAQRCSTGLAAMLARVHLGLGCSEEQIGWEMFSLEAALNNHEPWQRGGDANHSRWRSGPHSISQMAEQPLWHYDKFVQKFKKVSRQSLPFSHCGCTYSH